MGLPANCIPIGLFVHLHSNDVYAYLHNNSLTNMGLHHSSSISRQGVIAKPGGQRTVSLPQNRGTKAERSGLPHSPI